jgi:hypothetical protein
MPARALPSPTLRSADGGPSSKAPPHARLPAGGGLLPSTATNLQALKQGLLLAELLGCNRARVHGSCQDYGGTELQQLSLIIAIIQPIIIEKKIEFEHVPVLAKQIL